MSDRFRKQRKHPERPIVGLPGSTDLLKNGSFSKLITR